MLVEGLGKGDRDLGRLEGIGKAKDAYRGTGEGWEVLGNAKEACIGTGEGQGGL